MINDKYWIALQSIFGAGNPRAIELALKFNDIADLFSASKDEIVKLKCVTPVELNKLCQFNFDDAKSIIEKCSKNNYKIITYEDEEYPECFRLISNPPAVIYVMGELPDMDDNVGIAMVGTRNCTKNGLIIASVLGYRLAEAGAIIVSGGAKGIDTACSQGAVAVNAKSLIVLGCGLDYPYLLSNRKIRDSVLKNGAIITEYPPDTPPSKYTFPVRNRLISALAKGVVLVEAPEKSGALITVSFALEQGKDVYVIPGDITNKNYAGNNKLLIDGANAIYTPKDVLVEYIPEYPHRLNTKKADVPLNEDRLYINLYNKNINVKEDRYLRKSDNDYKKSEDKNKKKLSNKSAVAVKSDAMKDTKKAEAECKEFVLPELQYDADDVVKCVYNCFSNKPITIDNLVKLSGIKISDVMYAVTDLEINGVIESLPGGMFKIM